MSSLAKVNSILEKFWWAMTVATFILVLVMAIMKDFDKWAFYFLVPVLTILMALMRRFMRKKLEKSEAEKANREAESKK
jgi:membrane protein implicated in regulation of membrane protease activity